MIAENCVILLICNYETKYIGEVMKYYILIGTIIILIYIAYLYRYYILWFLNTLKVTIKNKKGIKDLQKVGMNNRNVDNDSLKRYINLSKKYLDKLGLSYNKNFILNKELERHLIYSRFSEKYLQELLIEILNFYKMSKENVNLKVNYISSKYALKYAGLYVDKDGLENSKESKEQNENKENIEDVENYKKEIILYIQNDMTLNTVISILAHECTHYLLMTHGIKIEKRIQNECLTDVTAVIAGFGKFMVDGYKISNKVIYDEINHRSIKKNRVGYLSYKDIEYVQKIYKRNINI